MQEPPAPTEPLDVHGVAQRHWWLRMMVGGASDGGDAASAVYGTILAASVLITVTASPAMTFLAVVGTAIVFWLAHVHVAVMRRIVAGQPGIGVREVRHSLIEEWPLVESGLVPAAPFVLAMLGVVSTNTATDLGLVICLLSLVGWGLIISRAARLTRRQTIFTAGVNVAFGVLLVLLKVVIH
ncbi:MAG: hypothetical protein ACR2JV_08490 [Gaiellales bacterium]